MTELEVLEKLDEYYNYIVKVKEMNKLLREELAALKKQNEEIANELEELKKPKPRKKRTSTKKEETKWNIEIPTKDGEKITVTGVPENTLVNENTLPNEDLPNEEESEKVIIPSKHKIVVSPAETELKQMIEREAK